MDTSHMKTGSEVGGAHELRNTWSPRSWKREEGPSPELSVGAQPCWHLDFCLLASGTVRGPMSVS